jgi:hypothetical protein
MYPFKLIMEPQIPDRNLYLFMEGYREKTA